MIADRRQTERWLRVGLIALPFVLAVLILLPRLLSHQFGFEDDGVSLAMARKFLSGSRIDSDDNVGIFRPLYWAGLVFEYWLGGIHPFGFYLTNLLVLLIIVAEILVLIRLKGGSLLQASLSAVLFVLSSPIIESFYTNSKPEAQQLLWLATSLISGHFLSHPKKARRIAAFLATTLFILLASLNKSTFIVLVPVSFGWWVLCGLILRRDQDELRRMAFYFASTLLATALFFILRQLILSNSSIQGTYSNNYTININFMIFMLNHWVVWLTRGYLGLLSCMVLGLVLWKRLGIVSRKMAIASLVWMFGWFVIYLPWDRALDYYLLPFALGYALFCGTIVGSLPDLWQELKQPFRIVALGLTALFGLLILMGTVTFASNGKVQLIMDRQDERLLDFLAKNTDSGTKIAVNLDGNSTFFTHVPLLMSIVKNRSDLTFVPFDFQNSLEDPQKPYLLIMPVVKNQPLSKVRGYGEGQMPVNQSLDAFVKGLKPVFQTSEQSRLLSFNPAILLCPFTGKLPFYSIYCVKPASILVDNRDYTFGWQAYEIDTAGRALPAPAVFTQQGLLRILNQDGTVSETFFHPAEHLLVADWNGDGHKDLIIVDPSDFSWAVYLYPFDQSPITVSVPGMTTGDIPLAGDWNCDGSASPGYYRPTDTTWHLWNDPDAGAISTSLTKSRPGDIPVVGDWDGNGCDTVGVYRPYKGEVNLENSLSADLSGIDFNAPKDSIPVAADWGGLGMDTLGFYKDGVWQISFANCECQPANGLKKFNFGDPADIPLAGNGK